MKQAEKYRICCGIWKSYIAKISKREPDCMTDDRREITDSEILTLINWKLQNWVQQNEGTGFIFKDNEGKKIEVHYVE